MKRWLIRVSSFNQKIVLTYVVVAACAAAISELQAQMPIIPINFYTLIWLLSLVFPFIATVYSLTKLRIRLNEILELARPDELWNVYFKDEDDPELAFERYVRRRLSEFYGLAEYAGYSLVAGAITLTFFTVIAMQLKLPQLATDAWLLDGPKWAILTGAAFLGSYAGSLVLVLRRYRTFDLRPTAFLQVNVMLVAGTLAGSFVTILFPVTELSVLAFIIAYLAAINVQFLSQLMKERFAAITGMQLPKDIKTDLDEVIQNTEAIEALKGISINSVRELACSEPIRIYFNVPQELNVIMDMIDEAVLRSHFADIADDLKHAHVTTFTQLISRLGAKFKTKFKKGEKTWPDTVSLLDLGGPIDTQILEGCKSIVKAGTYHILLGLRLLDYRKAHFSQKKKK